MCEQVNTTCPLKRFEWLIRPFTMKTSCRLVPEELRDRPDSQIGNISDVSAGADADI